MVVATASETKQIAKDIRRATVDSRFLESRWPSISRRHKNRWVGVYNKKLIYANTLPQILRRARAKNWDVGAMVVAHLEPRREAVLLRSRLGHSRIL